MDANGSLLSMAQISRQCNRVQHCAPLRLDTNPRYRSLALVILHQGGMKVKVNRRRWWPSLIGFPRSPGGLFQGGLRSLYIPTPTMQLPQTDTPERRAN